jgi:thioredoxin 1
MAIAITQENFEKEVKQATMPVVVDVYATWCGPCQYMAPIFAELEAELDTKYKFAKLNVDEARELSNQFGVTSIPTFLFIKNGSLVGKETKSMSKEVLKEKIENYLK